VMGVRRQASGVRRQVFLLQASFLIPDA